MLRRFLLPYVTPRRSVSALYVTGDKAMENFAVLSPFLEIEKRMKNFDEIKENVQRRRLSVKLDDLREEYVLFRDVTERKKQLEDRRQEIARLMKAEPAAEGLKIQGKIAREDLRKLKENSYHLEDQFVHKFLQLPNEIHEKTPNEKEVIFSHLARPIELGEKQATENLIEFFDPTCYYLSGPAAKFDLHTALDVCDYFRDRGFIKFSNPDFVRSIIPEGAGQNPDSCFLLKEDDIENKLNLLHLCGSASFLSFLPFMSKLIAFPTQFPMKFISSGRVYDSSKLYDHHDMYETVQSTCCQAFIATNDGENFEQVISEMTSHLKTIFQAFNQHYQIVLYPPDMLNASESFKMGVEMYSPSKNKYIEVGNLSYHGDFISKRLLFNYKNQNKSVEFPHLYSGTIINVMKVLVNLIESNNFNINSN